MKELKVIELYEKSSEAEKEEFSKNTNSEVNIKTDFQKTTYNTEWMDMMEGTMKYLDNILKNPNRFIVNDEEVVKIELAKKIGVESIKHLSKHTNLIQEIDENTGDVIPSKILNVNKEESFATYENRFIYTLIKTMKMFIARKKEQYQENANLLDYMNDKKIEFTGNTKVANENVAIKVSMTSSKDMKKNENAIQMLEKMDDLNKKIDALMASSLYVTLDKQRVLLVKSPIKKTNMILKNVNFQYAVKLWDYLQTHVDDDTKKDKKHKDYKDEGDFRKLVNETFYLQYLVMSTLDEEKTALAENDRVKDEITNQMLEQIVQLNPDMQLEELQEKIKRKYEVIKYRNLATTTEIQKIFKKNIDKFMEKNNLK